MRQLDSSRNLKISFLPVGAGDCILLQFNDASFNILIDAGPSRPDAKVEKMYNALLALVPNGIIDLAIVTHHDDDHIGGFLYLLSKGHALVIKDLIFNSSMMVDKLRNLSGLAEISPRQARKLSATKTTYNSRVVCAGQIETVYDGQIELAYLSPTEKHVSKYGVGTVFELPPPRDISVRRPFRAYADLQGKADEFKEDSSKSNLLSLALEVRFNGRSWLFLGDAWPSVVSDALDTLYPNSQPHYELVKVSHHGSNANTTAALLSQWSCSNYVFLADGRVHPHQEVFRRILDVPANTDVKFYFPERTPYLEGLFQHYVNLVNYPPAGTILTFNY